jgi:hypothetical protein
MNLKQTSVKRSSLNVLEESNPQILKLVIENDYSKKYIDIFKQFIMYLPTEKIDNLSKFIDFKNIMPSIDKTYLKEYIKKQVTPDENFDDLFELLYSKIKNNIINPILIFKISNYSQFVILSKFGMLLDTTLKCIELPNNKNESPITKKVITFPTKRSISYETILWLKDSNITKLVKMLEKKGKAKPYEHLEVALKLYLVFGFDDAKRIIDDKYSKLNESSFLRIVDFNYKDFRREYRAKNQNKFYYYGMEEKVRESLNNDTNGLNQILNDLMFEPNDESIDALRKELIQLMLDNKEIQKLDQNIKNLLNKIINEREAKEKNKYKEKIRPNIEEKMRSYPKMNTSFLLDLLKDVDLNTVESYSIETINELRTFFFGNRKENNDCLFRLIVNKEALGLNDNIRTLINNFCVLKYVSDTQKLNKVVKSTTKIKKADLSLNNVLDIIDILKMELYELKYNEQDITLNTLTRVCNSMEHVDNIETDIPKELCKLHVERKKKTYSNIPTVKGSTDEYDYFVAPFDAEYILAAGIDGRNCFKIAGLGEEFFRYCLTNKSAVIIYLVDKQGNKYICPTVRSGNGIHCNGIDPEPEGSKIDGILTALSNCFADILRKDYSTINNNKKIEVATVSNLHLQSYFDSANFEEYKLGHTLPIDSSCYCDYNKPNIKHYILAKSELYKQNEYYVSTAKYYQPRDKDYEFDVNKEYDKERLHQIINSIVYSSIEFLNISDKEKDERRQNFQTFDMNKFKYIIGNKDWFVAIDDNSNLISFILPYDERARMDYRNALNNALNIIERLNENAYGWKNI